MLFKLIKLAEQVCLQINDLMIKSSGKTVAILVVVPVRPDNMWDLQAFPGLSSDSTINWPTEEQVSNCC